MLFCRKCCASDHMKKKKLKEKKRNIILLAANRFLLFCYVDVNECLNLDACLNGGTCRNLIGSYRCECPQGWSGDKCELGKIITVLLTSVGKTCSTCCFI